MVKIKGYQRIIERYKRTTERKKPIKTYNYARSNRKNIMLSNRFYLF